MTKNTKNSSRIVWFSFLCSCFCKYKSHITKISKLFFIFFVSDFKHKALEKKIKFQTYSKSTNGENQHSEENINTASTQHPFLLLIFFCFFSLFWFNFYFRLNIFSFFFVFILINFFCFLWLWWRGWPEFIDQGTSRNHEF